MSGRAVVLAAAVAAVAVAGCSAGRSATLSTRGGSVSSTTVRARAVASTSTSSTVKASSSPAVVARAQAATAPADVPATTLDPVTTTEPDPATTVPPSTTTTDASPAPWSVECSTSTVQVTGGDPGVLYDVVVPWAQDPHGIRTPLTTSIPAGQTWVFSIPQGGPGTISVTSRETGQTQTCQPS